MKRILFLAGVIALLGAAQAAHSQGRFGAGFVVGDPSGLAWNYRIDRSNAVAGAVGFGPYDRYRLHADYLWTTRPFQEKSLGFHYGMGAAVGFGRRAYVIVDGQRRYYIPDDGPGLGIRGVAGLSYTIPDTPLDIFLEAAPMVVVTPGYGSGIDLGLGMRIYP
jgi:hypothetical protein